MENCSQDISSILHSQYIIDGVRFDVPPIALIDENAEIETDAPDIVDESLEPSIGSICYDCGKIPEYLDLVSDQAGTARDFNMVSPEHFARLRAASALIDMIWMDGHFRLGDLGVELEWIWNTAPVGNMAGFYRSVESVSGYLYDLGVDIVRYKVIRSACCPGKDIDEGSSHFDVHASLVSKKASSDEDSPDFPFIFKSSPYESRHPHLNGGRACMGNASGCESNWIIYIPFDICPFKTGGSVLAERTGDGNAVAPNIADPDYFIDCYEVLRELVEDSIIVSGVTVSDGGIARALKRFSSVNGLETNWKGVMSSYQEPDLIKILFSEVPGVLVEITDENFDYFDSQLLLQDVAYYPIGHPAPGKDGLIFTSDEKNALVDIISSLMGQASEGED